MPRLPSGSFRFVPYDESVDIPNVVVDGSPNRSTVLTLTHWPGIPQPLGMGADLSAQMAFRYVKPLLIPMITKPERFRELWVEEDERLTASEKAIADGRITIEELADVDLAVITVATDEPARVGHRFAGHKFAGVHPMAIHSATTCVRLLVVHGRRYQYVDRYETWVQYQSRKMPRRVELSPLAENLTDLERGAVSWHSEAPGSLTPTLAHPGESTLSADTVCSLVVDHLRTAEPAWDPLTDIDPD